MSDQLGENRMARLGRGALWTLKQGRGGAAVRRRSRAFAVISSGCSGHAARSQHRRVQRDVRKLVAARQLRDRARNHLAHPLLGRL